MDEHAYRQQLQAMPDQRCPFAQALIGKCVECARADRMQIAEREVVRCSEATCYARCVRLYLQLRHSFGFALGMTHDDAAIPHAKQMHIQCGGLQGLSSVLKGESEVDDVDALLCLAAQRWVDIEDIPYSEVIHAARLSYKGRHA